MSEVDWKGLLGKNELFRSLSSVEVERLLGPDTSDEREFAAGQQIIRQGERGRNLYLIGKGCVTITTPGPEGGAIELAMLEVGEFFGEMSLMRQQPRSATVSARDDCIVLRVRAEKLRSLLNQHPDILAGIFMLLSERMRDLADRIIDVSYHEVNNKLELFSNKLDAELRAMNSTLIATQTMFDQTNARAKEVITSTERKWTNMTIVGSAATTIFAIVVAVVGWFGINNFNDLSETAAIAEKSITDTKEAAETRIKSQTDQHLSELEAKSSDMVKQVELIQANAAEASKLNALLKDQYAALRSSVSYSVVPILAQLEERDPKSAQYYIPILQKNIGHLLTVEDEDSITILFRELYQITVDTLLSTEDAGSKKYRRRIRDHQRSLALIFSGVVERRETMPIRNVALAYYFLLSSLAIEENRSEFSIRFRELQRYLRDKKAPFLVKEDLEDFEPLGYSLAVGSSGFSEAEAKEIIQNIEKAWGAVSPS